MKPRLLAVLASASVAALAALPASAAPVAYEVDAVHSSLVFRIQHLGVGYVWGRFDGFKGSFTVDAEKPEASSVRFEVDASSISTGNKKRDDHLRSPDFFNVAQFPAITFQSTAVKRSGDVWEVTGDLSLHGVTKPVTMKLAKVGEAQTHVGYRIGFEGTLEIQRSAYGMTFMLDGLSDAVRLTLAVQGVRK